MSISAKTTDGRPAPSDAPVGMALPDFENLIAVTPNAVLTLDHDFVVTFVNGEALRIGRATAADYLGRVYWAVRPQMLGTAFEQHVRHSMESRQKERFDFFFGPFGIWVDFTVQPIANGLALFYQDITARKLAEEERDLAARQLQQVFDTTTDAVFSLDRHYNFTFLNCRAQQLLAVKGDLRGRNIWEEFPDALREGSPFPLHYDRAMEHGIAGEFEAYYPAPLNLWLSVQARPSDNGIVVFFRDITEERAARRSLLAQQEVLSFVQQTACVATWEIDLASGEMTFGSGSYPVFGRPLSEIRSVEDFRRLVLPSHQPLVQEATRSAIASGGATTIDYPVKASDGSTLWIEGRGIPVFDEHGAATHLRGMSTDITARKRNEVALAASEERYRVLADLNPSAMWVASAEGEIIYANQRTLDSIGWPSEKLGGSQWLGSIHPDDLPGHVEAWTRSMRTGEIFQFESRTRTAPEGDYRWWLARALPVRDETGEILQWLGVSVDVHDSRVQAEELKQKQVVTERERAELEALYQAAPIGLALFDPVEFRYLRLNKRQAEIVGLPIEQILGRTLTEIAPIEGLRETFEQVAQGHAIKDQILEGELPSRPGEHRMWRVNYSPVYAADGTIQAVSAASLEITNQRRAEAALIQSEKLAAVGRLASSISHEINNPLEAVTNILYLVSMSPELSTDLKGYVHLAQSELSRVSQIATQTLRFHRQAVRPAPVMAAELVNAVLSLYQGRLTNSGIHVDAVYVSSTRVVCFENDIRQVLNNLIANAIDAMRGGGRLAVRAHDGHDHATGRKGVRISIADTGHGMSPATQERLFEPFFTTKDLNGTGLGLWISAGIVERHQGRLSVRSSDDPARHGTVFTLFLPIAALDPMSDQANLPTRPA